MKSLCSLIKSMDGKRISVSFGSGYPSNVYPNSDFSYHYHDFIEIEFYLEGSGTHYHNTVPYHVKPGFFYLLMPGDYHCYQLDESKEYCMYNIKVAPGMLKPEIFEKLHSFPRPFAVYLEGESFDVVLREMQFMEECSHQKYDELFLCNAAERIMLFMLRHLTRTAVPIFDDVPAPISIVLDYVEKHYKETISTEDMAALTGFSKQYFCKYFKGQTEMVFCDYLNRIRLFHAVTLLDTTNLSMKEIAGSVGFSSQAYFSRIFSRNYGISPREYRSKTHT